MSKPYAGMLEYGVPTRGWTMTEFLFLLAGLFGGVFAEYKLGLVARIKARLARRK